MSDFKVESFGGLIVLVITLILLFLAKAFFLQLMWNWFIPDLFNLPVLSYVQSMGLLVVSALLFHSSNVSKYKNE